MPSLLSCFAFPKRKRSHSLDNYRIFKRSKTTSASSSNILRRPYNSLKKRRATKSPFFQNSYPEAAKMEQNTSTMYSMTTLSQMSVKAPQEEYNLTLNQIPQEISEQNTTTSNNFQIWQQEAIQHYVNPGAPIKISSTKKPRTTKDILLSWFASKGYGGINLDDLEDVARPKAPKVFGIAIFSETTLHKRLHFADQSLRHPKYVLVPMGEVAFQKYSKDIRTLIDLDKITTKWGAEEKDMIKRSCEKRILAFEKEYYTEDHLKCTDDWEDSRILRVVLAYLRFDIVKRGYEGPQHWGQVDSKTLKEFEWIRDEVLDGFQQQHFPRWKKNKACRILDQVQEILRRIGADERSFWNSIQAFRGHNTKPPNTIGAMEQMLRNGRVGEVKEILWRDYNDRTILMGWKEGSKGLKMLTKTVEETIDGWYFRPEGMEKRPTRWLLKMKHAKFEKEEVVKMYQSQAMVRKELTTKRALRRVKYEPWGSSLGVTPQRIGGNESQEKLTKTRNREEIMKKRSECPEDKVNVREKWGWLLNREMPARFREVGKFQEVDYDILARKYYT